MEKLVFSSRNYKKLKNNSEKGTVCEDDIIQKFVLKNLKPGKVVIFVDEEQKAHSHQQTEKVVKVLNKYNIKYKTINVEQNDPDNMKLALTIHTGYSKFPNIYFGEDHIGGLDDLQGILIQNEDSESLQSIGISKENLVEIPLANNGN